MNSVKTRAAAIAALAIASAAPTAFAQLDEGDIAVTIEDNRIITSIIAEEEEEPRLPLRGGELGEESRLFIAELGLFEIEPDEGDPTGGGPNVFQDVLPDLSSFVTNVPGFDSGAGVFDPAALVNFNILSFTQYDPIADEYVDTVLGAETEELGISFNFDAVLTGPIANSSVPVGTQFPSLPVFSNGRFHRHFLFTLLPVDDPNAANPQPLADSAVYLLELDISTTQAGIADSETFGILFAFGVAEGSPEFDNAVTAAALIFSEACALADISFTGTCNPGFGDGIVDLSDFSCYLSEWAAGNPVADITVTGTCTPGAGGDGVDLSDFSCYLSEWSGGCDGDPGTPL
ncbi:MAG: GC-type dockerin domain-anchored protein [Planctomycetota bacterium]